MRTSALKGCYILTNDEFWQMCWNYVQSIMCLWNLGEYFLICNRFSCLYKWVKKNINQLCSIITDWLNCVINSEKYFVKTQKKTKIIQNTLTLLTRIAKRFFVEMCIIYSLGWKQKTYLSNRSAKINCIPKRTRHLYLQLHTISQEVCPPLTKLPNQPTGPKKF